MKESLRGDYFDRRMGAPWQCCMRRDSGNGAMDLKSRARQTVLTLKKA